MLDRLDKKILKELETDSRQSFASIARKTKINKAMVKYRIERLEKRNIITGYHYVSNQRLLGKLSFGLLITFKDITLQEEEKLIKKIENIQNVSWVKSIEGKWDLVIVIIEKSIEAFNLRLQELFLTCGEQIKKYHFYIDHEGALFHHNYLYSRPEKKALKYGPYKTITLKKTEEEMYDLLKKDPKSSLLQIAHKLNKTYDTIKSKFTHLSKEGLLLTCTPNINTSLLGFSEYLCLFNLSPSQEKIKELTTFCSQHPNIVRYSTCLGDFNLILNIHCKNNKELKKILLELRSKHHGIINSYDVILLGE